MWACESGLDMLACVRKQLLYRRGNSLQHPNEITKNNQGRHKAVSAVNCRNEIINSTTERFWDRNNLPWTINLRGKAPLNFHKTGKTTAITRQQLYARSNGRRNSQLLVLSLPARLLILTDWLADEPIVRYDDWLTDWLTVWLTDWLTDWLAGLLGDAWRADGRSKNLSPFILLHCIAFCFISFHFMLETAVLPDPPVGSSSGPMPDCREYKETDSYQWHEEYVQNSDT